MTVSERQNAATFIEFTTVKPFLNLQANFKCLYCKAVFSEIHPALVHTSSHTTPDRTSLLKHHLVKGKRSIKVDISSLKCKICEQKYSNLNEIRQHLTERHNKVFNSAGNGLLAYDLGSKVGVFSCCECRKEFNSFFLLNQHMNVHSNAVCETCGRGFMSHARLMHHRIVHEKGSYSCDKCPEVFITKLKLRYHFMKKHEQENNKKRNPLKCPRCFERFSEHYTKMKHLKEKHGVVFTYECTECKTVFNLRRNLTEHVNKVHTKKIQCSYCGKCFGTRTLLNTHVRGHLGEKNFICNVCQKSYVHKKTLMLHMKTHDVDCTDCGVQFRCRKEYNSHVKQWHASWAKKTSEDFRNATA